MKDNVVITRYTQS